MGCDDMGSSRFISSAPLAGARVVVAAVIGAERARVGAALVLARGRVSANLVRAEVGNLVLANGYGFVAVNSGGRLRYA